jgi:hypothetical protein
MFGVFPFWAIRFGGGVYKVGLWDWERLRLELALRWSGRGMGQYLGCSHKEEDVRIAERDSDYVKAAEAAAH